MGTALTGLEIKDTYDGLVKITDNGPISGTAKFLSDGLGNDSALALGLTQVGIGTNTLFTTASIAASLPATSIGANFNAGMLNLQNTSTANGNLSLIGFQDANAFINLAALGAINTTHSASPNSVVGELAFYTKPSGVNVVQERMRITSTGNVGIGTSAPDQKLNIVGSQTTAYATSSGSEVVPLGGVNMTMQNTGTGGFTSMRFVSLDGSNAIGYLGFANTTSSIGGSFVFGQRSGGGYAEQVRIQAGGGISFNGDTAAANALDDYEEGTFTPSVAGATTAGTATYTQRVGVYTKIGRQVSVQIDLGWNSGTGTGLLTITGLPFADTSNTNPAITIGFFDGITLTASNYALAYIPSLSSIIDIVQTPVGGGTLTSVPYDAAGRIILNVTYTA
jgi:hypothetical protein